ncbi:HNH endonuclease [Natranaeroarchaeum sulfidigenes]|uniref:HNH endonuclease n=1 Tax=Natranaeroarchaeum sulfidigenes TaxID=2784880 RepID=UPI001EE576CD|nr:HNH endonuclease [Natranaeroarchaeum sulfidigenes]
MDVAYVLSWSDYLKHMADISNVLAPSKTHHAAFDRELFTIDRDYRLRVNPSFEMQSDLLQRTIIDQADDQVALPDGDLNVEYLDMHNSSLAWV